jgi:hypothetical protein
MYEAAPKSSAHIGAIAGVSGRRDMTQPIERWMRQLEPLELRLDRDL